MASPTPSAVIAPASVLALLDRLHQLSSSQEEHIDWSQARVDAASTGPGTTSAKFDADMRSQLVALDKDKSHLVYQLARAIGATNIVEAGSGFGVSTIYLALAVGQNCERAGVQGKVIATEKEPEKAKKAREHWKEAGDLVTKHIELREGDLLETLKVDLPQVDLLLLDIWTPLALPTLKLVQPNMRAGAVIIVDNTISAAEGYKDLLEHLRSPGSGFTNLTLPYRGGLEMSVYLPSGVAADKQ